MKRILDKLRNTDQGIARYILWALIIDFIPTALILAAVVFTELLLELPDASGESLPSLNVETACLLSPLLETLLLGLTLAFLKLFVRETLWVAALSAIIWGILHGVTNEPDQVFTVTWSFFVYSLCFLEWTKKSVVRAIVVTALLHSCSNVLLILLSEIL